MRPPSNTEVNRLRVDGPRQLVPRYEIKNVNSVRAVAAYLVFVASEIAQPRPHQKAERVE